MDTIEDGLTTLTKKIDAIEERLNKNESYKGAPKRTNQKKC